MTVRTATRTLYKSLTMLMHTTYLKTAARMRATGFVGIVEMYHNNLKTATLECGVIRMTEEEAILDAERIEKTLKRDIKLA